MSRFIREIPDTCMDAFSERREAGDIYVQKRNTNPDIKSLSAKYEERQAKFIEVSRSRRQEYNMTQKNYPTKPVSFAPAPKKNNPNVDWKIGDKVKHKKWGVGTVMSIEERDGKKNLEILFANPEIGLKSLKAQIAPIERA